MIKKALIAIVGAIGLTVIVFCSVVALQPSDFKISRSASMAAPPERVFTEVNDFSKWDAWSPWAKIDPNMKKQLSGPPSGVGAAYAWQGNEEVGEGKMTITESHPSAHVKIALDFIRPFAANNVIEFRIAGTPGRSDVTWTMSGKNNFVMKAFTLFFDMDKAVGTDFEKGLAQLKAVVEK